MKILIIQQKMIGDVLTSSILFEALREKYPNATLYFLINSHTYPVVENHPFIDEYIFYTKEIEASKIKFIRFLKQLRTVKYDVIIDVYGSTTTALICLMSKSKMKVAYHKNYTAFVYSHTIKRLKKPLHNSSLAIENRLKLLEPLGVEFKSYTPKIYLTDQEITNAKHFLTDAHINLDAHLFMIGVLGSSIEKTYPFKYMAALLDNIITHNPKAQLLFNYIPAQEEDARAILNLCHSKTKKNIFFNVFGSSLRDFLALTAHCHAFIGNEGGANNMAKALGIPTFTIFSPYLNKANWFGNDESLKHVAIHLADYIIVSENMRVEAKENPEPFYLKLKPEYLKPQLIAFLNSVSQ